MVDFYEMPASPTVIRCPRRVLPPPPADAKDVVALLRELDRVIGSGEATGLPVTLADLASIGVPATALDALRTLVAAGHHERIVVEAFLAALVARAGRRRAGRRVLRALRERALRSQGDAEVRASVDAIVASMQLRPRIGERLLGALREAAD
jgi:hypothetical protein